MIFNRLFKPKFQHPDPKIRIQSIVDLEPSNSADKQKLHELAFNDDQASVSIAALDKLNSFSLWLKMSQIAIDNRVSKSAEKKVLDILSDTQSELITGAERRLTIIDSNKPILIKFGLENSDLCGLDTKDIVLLLGKLNDDSYQRQLMLRTPIPDLQLRLIQQIDDLSTLKKLSKKALHPEVLSWLEVNIAQKSERAQRPIDLQREITLELSKLKALSEITDYAKIVAQRVLLEGSIETKNAELATLDANMATVNTEKSESITKRLDIVSEQLKPAYEEQRLKEQQDKQLAHWLKSAESAINAARQAFENAIKATEEFDLNEYVTRLNGVIEDSENLALFRNAAVDIKLKSARSSLFLLEQTPELVVLLSQIYSTIDNFKSTYSLPNDYQDIDQARQVFVTVEKQIESLLSSANGKLPSHTLKPWNRLKAEWREKLASLNKLGDQQVKATDKKLSTVNSMIKQGRYKAAFAVHSKIKRSYEVLPVSLQSRLAKTYTMIDEQISELADWQHYIAQPRKPEVLQEVLELVQNDKEVEVNQRAQDVARLRKTWLSFGQLNTPEDEELNRHFDQAIEQAFTPCRLYFAEQQRNRETNAQSALVLLDELKASEGIEEDAMFLKAHSAALKKWSNLGQIEKAKWQELKSEFVIVNTKLKQRQKDIHTANAKAKQLIVAKVEEIAKSVVPESAELVKKLQGQWKRIGFAGKGKDNQLWASFKQTNDQIFESIRAGREQVKQEAQKAFDSLQSKLEENKVQLNQVSNNEELKSLTEQLSIFEQEFTESIQKNILSHSQVEQLRRELQALLEDISRLKQNLNIERTKQKVDETFKYLFTRIGEASLLDDSAPKLLSSAFNERVNVHSNRLSITLRLELLVGAESPAKDSERRNQIQLEVMAKKMQSGEVDTVKGLFSDWISLGAISGEEKPLLARFENAYKLGIADSNLQG